MAPPFAKIALTSSGIPMLCSSQRSRWSVFMSLRELFDITESAIAGALPTLGGKEDVVAAVLHDAPYVPLAPPLGESVSGGGVDEVDAEIDGSLDKGYGDVEVVGLFDSALAAEREDTDLIAGL